MTIFRMGKIGQEILLQEPFEFTEFQIISFEFQ